MSWRTRLFVLFWSSIVIYTPISLYNMADGQAVAEAMGSYFMLLFLMVLFGVVALPAAMLFHWMLRENIKPSLQNSPIKDQIAFGAIFIACFFATILFVGGFPV